MTKRVLVILFSSLCLFLFACQGEQDMEEPGIDREDLEEAAEELSPIDEGDEEVRLTIWGGLLMDEVLFEEEYLQPLQAKFPHIHLELLPTSLEEEEDYATYIQVNLERNPDIILAEEGVIYELLELDLEYDLQELAHMFDFDLTLLDSNIMESLTLYDEQQRMLALPYHRNLHALYYNKSLFDQLEISYPDEQMNWQEILALAREIESKWEEEQGLGLFVHGVDTQRQLGLQLVDPDSQEIMLSVEPPWTTWLDFYLEYTGMLQNRELLEEHSLMLFMEGRAAMATGSLNEGYRYLVDGVMDIMSQEGEMEWDMVAYPSFDEAEGVGPATRANVLAIHPATLHAEEAFQVIAYLLSEEKQLENARQGIAPVYQPDSPIYHEYGAYLPTFAEKNLSALFQRKSAVLELSPYEAAISRVAMESFREWESGVSLEEELPRLKQQLEEQLRESLR